MSLSLLVGYVRLYMVIGTVSVYCADALTEIVRLRRLLINF